MDKFEPNTWMPETGGMVSVVTNCPEETFVPFPVYDTLRQQLAATIAERSVFWSYFKPPFRFAEIGDAYYVVDSHPTCQMKVMLMWPTHPAEETEAAEIETRSLGEVFAAAANAAHASASSAAIGSDRPAWDRNDDVHAAQVARADRATIDTLRQQLAAAKIKVSDLTGAAHGYMQELEATKTERDRAVKDAERYRWLRDTKNEDAVSSMIRIQNYGEEAYLLDGADLDEAIDAAIAAAAGDAGGRE